MNDAARQEDFNYSRAGTRATGGAIGAIGGDSIGSAVSRFNPRGSYADEVSETIGRPLTAEYIEGHAPEEAQYQTFFRPDDPYKNPLGPTFGSLNSLGAL